MACYNNGCSDCDPCNQCEDTNPCYEDCGCLNPTTWSCISHPGIQSSLGVVDSMNGSQVLAAINARINNIVVGIPAVGDDKYAKVSATDPVSDYLTNKILVNSPVSKIIVSAGINERIRLGIDIPALVSGDSSNLVQIGTDGKLRVLAATQAADIKVQQGAGVTVTGSGPATDPYIISINPSITATRPCFDGVWRNTTLAIPGSASVVYNSGQPQYRYRFDGTIEFRGSSTYTVDFGTYLTANRKFIIPALSIPTTCVTSGEQTGVSDLKGINYIDANGVGDQITQQFGYIIRKNSQSFSIEFQSSYLAPTTKTIVVNWEGVVVHPYI